MEISETLYSEAQEISHLCTKLKKKKNHPTPLPVRRICQTEQDRSSWSQPAGNLCSNHVPRGEERDTQHTGLHSY